MTKTTRTNSPKCHVTANTVVKILLAASLVTSALFRWTILNTNTRTAFEVSLDEFAFGKSSSPSSSMVYPNVGPSTSSLREGIRLVRNDLRGRKSWSTASSPYPTTTCRSPLLQRSLRRIPGYIEGCGNETFYGYVMRDLSNRWLYRPSRRDASDLDDDKTVVVASDDARNALLHIQASDPSATREERMRGRGYRVGASFVVDALWYNHTAVALNEDADNDAPAPDNVFLLVLDSPPPPRSVTGKTAESRNSTLGKATRQIIASRSTRFAVVRIAAMGRRRQQNFVGLDMCRLFFKAGYKLQILSSSHVVDGINPYPPNALLKGVPHIQRFLQHGHNLTSGSDDEWFQSYLFATRGWELAIPSRKEYMDTATGLGNDHVIDVEKEGIPFRKCRDTHEDDDDAAASISILPNAAKIACFGTTEVIDGDQNDYMHVREHELNKSNGTVIHAQVWMGHTNISMVEAACVKCIQQSAASGTATTTRTVYQEEKIACVTRALTDSPHTVIKGKRVATSDATSTGNDEQSHRRNLLAFEIKGLGQETLKHLPSLRHILSLESLGFDFYPNYVGSDSDFSVFRGNGSMDLPDLWMRKGYQVFSSSTKCRGHVATDKKQLSENLYHGGQVQDMFCFDHDRPHCLGGKFKPQILVDAATQFMQQRLYRKEPWAAFLSFPEGREDETETLIDMLDIPLTNFLSKLANKIMSAEEWVNTVIAIYSDDVAVKPVLFFKHRANATKTDNLDMFVTPFDVHQTLRELAKEDSMGGRHMFLTSPSPPERSSCSSILDLNRYACANFSNLREKNPTEDNPTPPSILSFYADIPKTRKMQLHMDHNHDTRKRARVARGCMCATNVQTWFKCEKNHPWDVKDDFREYFMLVDCPGKSIHFEVRMLPNDVLLKRSQEKRNDSGYTNSTNVSIMFLEIDSVSLEYADRHFPKTRELLKEYRIRWNVDKGQFECPSNFCSADFSQVSLVGANSIPNQVAALAGCLSSSTKEMCGLNATSIGEICDDPVQPHYGLRLERVRVAGQAYWCLPRDMKKVKTPWIFGVLDTRGYINFFGEEFCYEASPYVTQGNVFSTFYQDIESHHVYCRLAERKSALENLKIPDSLRWAVDLAGPCIDGSLCSDGTEKATISLQFLQKMWGTYRDTPKFAFLNAIAAHDYSFSWEQTTVVAERYDKHLSQFLRGMLSRSDSQKTVIILRSDHGLQRGPMAMDYALQVEHRRPWTEILVPRDLIPSKDALYQNQERMTTGFDLYTTIRSILSRSKGQPDDDGVPRSWSFDLLSDVIPVNRTCREAKVDPRLCRRVSVPRDYGVCNVLDSEQTNFCSVAPP